MASGRRSVPGHHGTRAEWASSIVTEGFRPSVTEEDWLGDGSYFFEDAPQMAHEWANLKHPDHEPCIFEAEIDLSRCLDLLDGEGQDRLQPFYERRIRLRGRETVAEMKQKFAPDAFGDFDCDVINFACDSLAEGGDRFDVVRAACRAAGRLYEDPAGELPSSRFYLRDHIQLAVRNRCAILGFSQIDPPTAGKGGHGAE